MLCCYCAECGQSVAVDLCITGKPLPAFREASLLCTTSGVRVGWDDRGFPRYEHRVCGGWLQPKQARPLGDVSTGLGEDI